MVLFGKMWEIGGQKLWEVGDCGSKNCWEVGDGGQGTPVAPCVTPLLQND